MFVSNHIKMIFLQQLTQLKISRVVFCQSLLCTFGRPSTTRTHDLDSSCAIARHVCRSSANCSFVFYVALKKSSFLQVTVVVAVVVDAVGVAVVSPHLSTDILERLNGKKGAGNPYLVIALPKSLREPLFFDPRRGSI